MSYDSGSEHISESQGYSQALKYIKDRVPFGLDYHPSDAISIHEAAIIMEEYSQEAIDAVSGGGQQQGKEQVGSAHVRLSQKAAKFFETHSLEEIYQMFEKARIDREFSELPPIKGGEQSEYAIKALIELRNYFGENDKTPQQHRLFNLADKSIKSLAGQPTEDKPDFRQVIQDRINYFYSKHHTYEANELSHVLETITRLIPPIMFQIGQPPVEQTIK